MGATGSGKTSVSTCNTLRTTQSQPDQFINIASKSDLAVGSSLKSCTEDVQDSGEFTVDGCPVVLIDTPGFQDTFKSDMDILNSIAQSLAER